MTKLEKIKRKLKLLQPILKGKYKVERIGIFGSYLRKGKKRGDLDLLVELYEPIGLFDFIELEDFLSKTLRVKVDLVMKEVIKPRIKERIIKETIYV